MLLVCFFCSCRKDPTIPEPYFPPEVNLVSTVGSWWKYENYYIDSLGQATATGIIDTIFVVGDSIINGNTYIHLSGTSFGFTTYKFIRDSLTYIVNSDDQILCSYENFGDTTSVFTSIPYKAYGMTKKPNAPLVVPAGTFDVYDQQFHYYNNNGTPFTACDTMWIKHEYFSDGIGVIVSQTAFVTPLVLYCQYIEQRLVEYYIAP